MTNPSPIDMAAIGRLTEWGGHELPRKMIDIFLSSSTERMQQIRDGLADGIAKTAETGAHSLKSSAANLGAHQVQELARRAEAMAEEEQLEELKTIMPELEEAFAEACEALKLLLEGMEG